MATPVFKFNHPDLPDEDLYFIHNTDYELPETIPMDLTSFISYHLMTGRYLKGFLYCWDDLLKTGSTLEDVDFETWFNEEEKSKLYTDALASSALKNAIALKTTSELLKDFIKEKKYEQEDIESLYYDLTKSMDDFFRIDEYYHSRSYLFEHLQTLIDENQPNYNEESEPDELVFEKDTTDDYDISGDFDDLFKLQYTLDDVDINNFDQEELLISLYSHDNTYIPLHLIPHKYRNSGFFRDECIYNNLIKLIPFPINDHESVLKAVMQNGSYLKFVAIEFRNNREIVLSAVKNFRSAFYGVALESATEDLKNDREIVLEAVKGIGLSLEFASEKLRNDREIVLEAVKNYGNSLEFASDELRNDSEIVLNALESNKYALKFASEAFRNDPEIVLEAVKKYGHLLKFVSEELRHDRRIVFEAIKNSGEALEFTSEELKNDREIVLEAVRNYEILRPVANCALNFASEELKNDREIVMEAVRNNGLALEFASEELKNDRGIVLEAVRNHSYSLRFASEALRNDLDIQQAAKK
jgi:hypothetical protein